MYQQPDRYPSIRRSLSGFKSLLTEIDRGFTYLDEHVTRNHPLRMLIVVGLKARHVHMELGEDSVAGNERIKVV